jgi:peptidoglycan/LPS O-acetylase OafA/YrhL
MDLLKKYLLWAVPLTAFFILTKSNMTIRDGIINLIIGGPMPAYWFFVLIIILLLVSPFFVFLVKEHIRIAAALMIVLQILVFLRYYYIDFMPPLLVEKLLFRSLTFAPPFIFGMIVAVKTQHIIDSLKDHKNKLLFFVIICIFLCIVESLAISSLNNWNPAKIQSSFATERISLNLLFIAAAMYILMQEDKPSGLRNWLTKVGIASFGIFLMTDIYNMLLNIIIWHLPLDWIGFANSHLTSNDSIPMWLSNASLWFLPLYIGNGLFLPLLTMKYAKKYLGKRVSALW